MHGTDRDQPSAHAQAELLAGIGTWTLEVATGSLTVNAAARSMLGWPAYGPAPQLGDFLAAVHPEDQQLVDVHARQLVTDGLAYCIEHRVLGSDGEVRYMRASAAADLDAAGGLTFLRGITLDVTEPRLAAEQALQQRRRSRAVLAALDDGYCITDGGVITEVNAALCGLTGFTEAELLGTRAPFPFSPPNRGPEHTAFAKHVRTHGTGRAVLRAVHKDGTVWPVAVSVSTLPRSGDDSVTGPLLLAVLRDVSIETERERVLRTLAATDPLTGLPNSRTFRHELLTAVRGACAADPLCLALIDVDYFKAVNDEFGHAAGDDVLVMVAQRLSAALHGAGTIARVGGEEFAVLLPGVTCEVAREVLEAALAALRTAPFPVAGTITASAGVAQLNLSPDPVKAANELYRLADTRLYEAKAAGRDRVK